TAIERGEPVRSAHLERPEDRARGITIERLVFDRLDDERRERSTDVGIRVAAARSDVEKSTAHPLRSGEIALEERAERFARIARHARCPERVEVVLDRGRVREELPERDRNAWMGRIAHAEMNALGHVVVEREYAFLNQLHDRDADDWLTE